MRNVIVIIPAYNEEKTVGLVVKQIFQMFHAPCSMLHALVIDDGSADNTARVAREAGAQVFSHPINRGLGAALSTGIEAALRLLSNTECFHAQHSVLCTLDADGQHDPADISRVIEPIVNGNTDVVIGSRFKGRMQNAESRMPVHRLLANWCGNFFTWLLFGIWVSDSQSGFRAFRSDVISNMKLRTSTMEVSSEIIREIARLKLRLAEVPITARYTQYSLSKGQGFFRGLETLWKLIILRFFR